jgi:hypothetical protein
MLSLLSSKNEALNSNPSTTICAYINTGIHIHIYTHTVVSYFYLWKLSVNTEELISYHST